MKKFDFFLMLKVTIFLLCSSLFMNVSAQTVNIQIINNTADTTIDSIDVWVDDIKVDSNIAVGKMRPILTIAAGTHDVTFSRKGSVDTTNDVLDKNYGITFTVGETYLAMICGQLDTTQYATNPDGVSRLFTIKATNAYREAAVNPTDFDLTFFNGSPDAPTFDVNIISSTGSKIADDESYAAATFNYVSITPGKYIISLTNKDSNVFYSTHLLDLTSAVGQAGVLFTSGVYDSTANPISAKKFKLYLAFANGTIKEIPALKSTLQIIHNSADSIYDSVDVYINNVKKLSNFGFRSATPFWKIAPYTPCVIAVAPKNSASIAEAFFTKSLATVIDSSEGYYAVLSGLKNPASYKPNPDAKSTGFTIFIRKGAKTTSALPKNIDLLYHHGATDLMTTSMLNYNGSMFISKDDAYGDFHSIYSYNPALDNLAFELKNAAVDTLLLIDVVGNISERKTQAGLIFASGFYTNLVGDTLVFPVDTNHKAVLTQNQIARKLGLYIAWPDGKVDTIQKVKPITGVNEVLANKYNAIFYPNPTSQYLTISFELKSNAVVSAELFDINGRLVTAMSAATKLAGSGELVFDMNTVVNGIYFCSLTVDGQKTVRKISVIK
jgi:hypothetical protein